MGCWSPRSGRRRSLWKWTGGNTDWGHKVTAYERARRQSGWQQALHVDGWRPGTFPAVLCVTPSDLARTAMTGISQSPGQNLA